MQEMVQIEVQFHEDDGDVFDVTYPNKDFLVVEKKLHTMWLCLSLGYYEYY